MRFHQLTLVLAAAGLSASLAAKHRHATVNPLDTVPDTMPFDIPYGVPISLDRAASAIAAAVAEAKKHDWKLNVAVVDSGATWSRSSAWTGLSSRRSRFRSTRRGRRELPARDASDGGWRPVEAELLPPHT